MHFQALFMIPTGKLPAGKSKMAHSLCSKCINGQFLLFFSRLIMACRFQNCKKKSHHKIRIIFLMSSLNTKKNICMEKYAHCFSPNAKKLRLFSQVFHFHLKFVWISSSLKEKNSYRVIITR